MIFEAIQRLGASTLHISASTGSFVLFLSKVIKTVCTTRLKIQKLFVQMERIGVESLPIVVLTGTFAGMVFALQSYIGFQRVGGEQFIGAIVSLGMIRELGPVLTGLMVTGRAGSAITAEIGTMNITEQIDALRVLLINPYQYLAIPRILGATIIMSFLTIFAMIFGIIGGYVVCVYVLELSGEDFISNIRLYVEMKDIIGGLIKATTFGLILSWVGCYKGFNTMGGARGVGRATTQSVVLGSLMILGANYMLTKILEKL